MSATSGGTHVSSTAIRRLIEAGKLSEAERLLGHPIRITENKGTK